MKQSLSTAVALLALSVSFFSHAGVVVESTRYLYKEGSREISAQMDNKDDTPYLMKSWVEAPEGGNTSYFMVTPPLFRLEARQKNTVRIFPNANISAAPKDRDSVYFFNVMAIPPTDGSAEGENRLQLAVRHRMRLIYRPKSIQSLSANTEARKLEWTKNGRKITLKNPTPFFIYFKSVQIKNKEFRETIAHVGAFSTREFTLPYEVDGREIMWKIATDHGGAGSSHTSTL